ncbi:hypothetical protein PENSPDRAFT_482316 [Peniophora sp. CONT]|nr:hypothetical protein PENSPDRAFT_482316 [Peniophora sp. CONT]
MHITPNLLITALIYVQLPIVAMAQDQNFPIPSEWRNHSFSPSTPQIISVAQNAVNALAETVNSTSNGTNYALDTWQSANVLASIAQFDYVSGTTTNHNLVRQSFTAFQSSHPVFFASHDPPHNVTSDPLMWGLAAFHSYRAYNDSDLLEIATSIWSSMQEYVVTAQDVNSGTPSKRNGTLPTNCPLNTPDTSVGAVFWSATNPGDYTSTGETVGAYVALSAHLWEATNNTDYLDSADQSAQFMYTHMYSDHSQVIQHTFDVLKWLTVLSAAPPPANSKWASMLLQRLVEITVTSSFWTTPNDNSTAGILFEASTQNATQNSRSFNYRNIFIGALLEIWLRTDRSRSMAAFIEAFIAVQFNALQDLAFNNGTYSPIWTSPAPPEAELLPWGQLAAIPVLNAAFKIVSNSSPPTSSSTGAPSPTSSAPSGDPSFGSDASSSSRSLSGGAIAGIVIGSVGGFVLMVASVFLALRYKRRLSKERQVTYPSFVPSAMYRQPAEMTGAVGLLPAEYSWEDEHGYGSGQRYLTEKDSAAEPSVTGPLAEKSSAE